MGLKKWLKNAHGDRFANFGMRSTDVAPKVNAGDFEASGRDLPARVDLRRHCSEIEDQAQSNSCCANAAAGAYEYLLKRWADSEGKDADEVSRLFIYFIGRKFDLNTQGQGNLKVKDEGMSIGGAVDAMHAKGACRKDFWPFDLDNVNSKPSEDAFDDALNCKISESRSVPVDVTAMKQALADGYPILTGLKLTKRFFSPGPSGKIATPDKDDPQSAEHGLHAMLIVGYSDKQEVFIYRNSWGTSWGDNGYGYVPYSYAADPDFNFCGQYIIKGLTELDLSPEEDEDEDDLFEDPGEYEDDEEVEEEDEDDGDDEEDDEDDPEMFSMYAELRKVFNKYDHDGSGSLGTFELMAALWMMGMFAPPRVVNQIIEEYDTDGTGNIGFSEWCAMNGVEAED